MREKEVEVKKFPELIEKLYGQKILCDKNASTERVTERILRYVRKV